MKLKTQLLGFGLIGALHHIGENNDQRAAVNGFGHEVEAGSQVGGAVEHGVFDAVGPASDLALAVKIYGWYAGLVYFTPILGGWIADRLLGARRTVLIGVLLMSAGLLLLSRRWGGLYAQALSRTLEEGSIEGTELMGADPEAVLPLLDGPPPRDDDEENRQPGMGLQFVDLSPAQREQVLRLVRTFAYLPDEDVEDGEDAGSADRGDEGAAQALASTDRRRGRKPALC